MSRTRSVIGVAAGAVGVAAAGGAARYASIRLLRHRPMAGDELPLGSLRSDPHTVVADDGLPLYAEVDEYEGRRARPPITLVFVHGYCLNLDSWHFQRAAYRGILRTVFYDQRSHGRSGRSPSEHATIDQLGRDLARVIDDLSGDDQVIVVGHSMGGMTILSLAEQRPDLFGTKIVGTALISTTAGGLDPGRIIFPMLPAGIGGGVIGRVVRAMSRGHKAVDAVRRMGKDVAIVVTDLYAFGDDVPGPYIQFAYDLLSGTTFDVVADFFPAFATLDVWHAAPELARVPTAIICGTADKLTAIGHSRKLHARIHGSDLLECEGAGHLVPIERNEDVNHELDRLVARVIDTVVAP